MTVLVLITQIMSFWRARRFTFTTIGQPIRQLLELRSGIWESTSGDTNENRAVHLRYTPECETDSGV